MPHMVKHSKSIYDLFEAILNDCLKDEWINEEFFKEFIEVKEASCGRDN